jgi:hypothetical protein
MDNTTLQRIQDALQKSRNIAVAVGRNPSIDQMGAALSLYLSLKEMGKNISILSVTEPIVELSNLVGIDKVKMRYEGEGADLVVSFPYREGEIEKVSYTLENGYLNIVVKAGEQGLSFSEQDIKYLRGSNAQLDLLFVIGTERLSDIHGIFGPDMLKDVTVINIDNKQENQGYGDIVLVSSRFSSISEQITQLLSDLKAPVNNDIAQNLLDGITYETENFQSPKTSFLAFEMAGVLMRQGALRVRGQQATVRQRQDLGQSQLSQQRRQQPQQVQDKRQQFDQRRQQPRPQQHNQGYQQPHQNQAQHQAMPQHQDQPDSQTQPEEVTDSNPPTDWLTPKVYKGSSEV